GVSVPLLPVLPVLLLSAAVLHVLAAAGRRPGTAGVRPAAAAAGHDAAAVVGAVEHPGGVLVLLPERQGVLPQRADVPGAVGQGSAATGLRPRRSPSPSSSPPACA